VGRPRRAAILALLVVSSLFLAGGALAAGPLGGGRILVKADVLSDGLTYRPHALQLSGDGTFYIYAIRWWDYGGDNASGPARAYVRGCAPYCAAGKVFHPKAEVRLSRVVECEGHRIYAHLRYAVRGRIPSGFRRHGDYSLLPTNETGEPSC
jgi:hypothetical protein